MIEKEYKYSGNFPLEGGGSLDGLTIRYHVSCENPDGKDVVWICHALTANSNPEEWWDTLVGKGKLFDTEKYYIVCANVIGSCYGTTGPSNYSKAMYREFPLITIRDIVKAHELLRKYLSINQIDFLVGGSNGGFQSIEWAVSNPDIIKNLCLIATNAIVSPWCTAFMESQRAAIEVDATFRECMDLKGGAAGLEVARGIALLSYRSYAGYCKTQQEQDQDFMLAKKAVTYQQYQGKKLSDRFDAYSYFSLALGVDTHNTGRGRNGVEAALKRIKAKTLCIAIDSDILFPVCESEAIVDSVEGASLEVISSDFGHDGFLLEYEQITAAIKKHFDLFD